VDSAGLEGWGGTSGADMEEGALRGGISGWEEGGGIAWWEEGGGSAAPDKAEERELEGRWPLLEGKAVAVARAAFHSCYCLLRHTDGCR
jgi:hypothetical protein